MTKCDYCGKDATHHCALYDHYYCDLHWATKHKVNHR